MYGMVVAATNSTKRYKYGKEVSNAVRVNEENLLRS